MICARKMILSLVSLWCILTILENITTVRDYSALRIKLHVIPGGDVQQLIEPTVRSLKLRFQISGVEPQITVEACRTNAECQNIIKLLVKNGLIDPNHSHKPDLVLYLDSLGKIEH